MTIETSRIVGSMESFYYDYFRGALSFAYYDNVVIEYNYISTSSTVEKKLLLNVGGCGTITYYRGRSDSTEYEITDVSGSITYWI